MRLKAASACLRHCQKMVNRSIIWFRQRSILAFVYVCIMPNTKWAMIHDIANSWWTILRSLTVHFQIGKEINVNFFCQLTVRRYAYFNICHCQASSSFIFEFEGFIHLLVVLPVIGLYHVQRNHWLFWLQSILSIT